MARVFIDGFESGGVGLWTTVGGSAAASAVSIPAGFSGTYYLNAAGNGDYLIKSIPAAGEYYIAFKYMPKVDASGTYPQNVFMYLNSTTNMVSLRRVNGNTLTAYRGTTSLEADDNTLNNDTVYFIEAYIKIGDADGRFVVKIDGTTVIDYTGDTKPSTQTTVDNLRLGYDGYTSRGNAYFDDLVLDDADWIGNTKIQGILPTGAGTTTQWDPSAGSNYASVDELPASDADYVSTNTVDEIDTYAAGNLSGSIETVKCVQLQARCAYEGSPTPTHLQLGVRISSTDYFATDKSPPSSFGTNIFRLLEASPATAGAWSESEINGMEIGVKATA